MGGHPGTGGRIGCAIVLIVIFAPIIYNFFEKAFNPQTSSTSTPTHSLTSEVPPSSTTEVPVSSTTVKPFTFNGYTLNHKEQKTLKVILFSEFYDFLKGKEVTVDPQIFNINAVSVTSDKLQYDYESNEVAGDTKYRGKPIFVSGVVSSINRSIGENYYISLSGGSNMFTGGPHASMADGFVDYLANLQKGQLINLLCNGNGMLIGSAVLSECVPTKHFIDNNVDSWVEKISQQFHKGKKEAQQVVLLSVAIASILPNSDDCSGDDSAEFNKCIVKYSQDKQFKDLLKQEIPIAAEKLKIPLPQNTENQTENESKSSESDSNNPRAVPYK